MRSRMRIAMWTCAHEAEPRLGSEENVLSPEWLDVEWRLECRLGQAETGRGKRDGTAWPSAAMRWRGKYGGLHKLTFGACISTSNSSRCNSWRPTYTKSTAMSSRPRSMAKDNRVERLEASSSNPGKLEVRCWA